MPEPGRKPGEKFIEWRKRVLAWWRKQRPINEYGAPLPKPPPKNRIAKPE